MLIKEVNDLCRRAMTGDQSALEELGLDNVTFNQPNWHNTQQTSLQNTYNAVLNTAVAARELQHYFLERQCQLTLNLIKTIANAKKFQLMHKVDGQDVAETMLALIDEEEQRDYIEDRATGNDEESDEDSVLIHNSRAPEKHSTQTSALCEESAASDETRGN